MGDEGYPSVGERPSGERVVPMCGILEERGYLSAGEGEWDLEDCPSECVCIRKGGCLSDCERAEGVWGRSRPQGDARMYVCS